jgi:DNA polymerase-3 subunit gamma/tau
LTFVASAGGYGARLEFVAVIEKIELEHEAAVLISRIADGAMRDALSILDRCSAKGEKITTASVSECVGIANRDYLFKMADYICSFQASQALELLNDIHNNSCDMERLCSDLINHFRNLMIVKTVKQAQSLIIALLMSWKDIKGKALIQT